jgi:hypothetical protein
MCEAGYAAVCLAADAQSHNSAALKQPGPDGTDAPLAVSLVAPHTPVDRPSRGGGVPEPAARRLEAQVTGDDPAVRDTQLIRREWQSERFSTLSASSPHVNILERMIDLDLSADCGAAWGLALGGTVNHGNGVRHHELVVVAGNE